MQFWDGYYSSVHVQSCPTLCHPMGHSPPGSSVHGILQARILEWVAISFSRRSSRPRNRTQVSCIAGRFFTELQGGLLLIGRAVLKKFLSILSADWWVVFPSCLLFGLKHPSTGADSPLGRGRPWGRNSSLPGGSGQWGLTRDATAGDFVPPASRWPRETLWDEQVSR